MINPAVVIGTMEAGQETKRMTTRLKKRAAKELNEGISSGCVDNI